MPQDASCAYLWQFPESGFDQWRAMPDTPALESYGDYLAVIAALQADIERKGTEVRRVRMSVIAMIAELENRGFPNDVQHRTRIIGLLGAGG